LSDPEAIVGVVFFAGLFAVLFRITGAVARRIAAARRGPTPDELALLRAELGDGLEQVRREVAELAERVDFTERLLAKQRDGERLVPPRSA
jgi:hypothetical protein